MVNFLLAKLVNSINSFAKYTWFLFSFRVLGLSEALRVILWTCKISIPLSQDAPWRLNMSFDLLVTLWPHLKIEIYVATLLGVWWCNWLQSSLGYLPSRVWKMSGAWTKQSEKNNEKEPFKSKQLKLANKYTNNKES